jgi:hypothetical protein
MKDRCCDQDIKLFGGASKRGHIYLLVDSSVTFVFEPEKIDMFQFCPLS